MNNIHARFAFGIFLCLSGASEVGIRVLQTFLDRAPAFGEALSIAEQVCNQIRLLGNPSHHMYRGYRGMLLPECGLVHYNDLDMCPSCLAVHYYLEISDLC